MVELGPNSRGLSSSPLLPSQKDKLCLGALSKLDWKLSDWALLAVKMVWSSMGACDTLVVARSTTTHHKVPVALDKKLMLAEVLAGQR